MDRRAFLRAAGAAGAATLSAGPGAFAQSAREEPDPEPVGEGKLDVLTSGADGRIIVTDSTSYLDKRVNENDVVVASSFAGPTIIGGALTKSVKALIAHDAGVGKDQAAIGGLPYGDRYGVPVAAVACRTATLSNGNSALAGTISHANQAATRLGVRAGQPAREAAQLLLKAAPGKPVPLALDLDNKLYEMEVTPKGRILAIWALFYLPKDATYPNDVFSVATHSARVAAEHAFRWNVKGWISNDAGPGKNNSGISGLAMCGEKGMPAAAVAAMSARIGDGLSTYREGIISAVNEPARAKGIAIGMTAKDALQLMIA
jgi:uncharacterized protein YunC (DUF1805 family)